MSTVDKNVKFDKNINLTKVSNLTKISKLTKMSKLTKNVKIDKEVNFQISSTSPTTSQFLNLVSQVCWTKKKIQENKSKKTMSLSQCPKNQLFQMSEKLCLTTNSQMSLWPAMIVRRWKHNFLVGLGKFLRVTYALLTLDECLRSGDK